MLKNDVGTKDAKTLSIVGGAIYGNTHILPTSGAIMYYPQVLIPPVTFFSHIPFLRLHFYVKIGGVLWIRFLHIPSLHG